jgi:acetyl-CoA C-acetyltransferase
MKRICIVRGKRTPQGRFMGSLAKYTPLQLGVAAAEAALDGIDRSLIDMVIVGRVMPPDNNVGRQILVTLGIPNESPGFTVNMACASGMKAANLAADAIQLGQANVVLAGGVESMTNAPHVLQNARFGSKMGDMKIVDHLLVGLSDEVIGEHMGQTAERLAEQYGINRAAQDKYAYDSHMKALAAHKDGAFADELVPLPELDHDEHPRADTTIEKLGTLKTVFKKDGTVTPGNASGINDAGAMMLICDDKTAAKHGWEPLCYLDQYTQVGCDPRIMGIGPAHAFTKLCAESGTTLNDFDAIEINEAFAAQAIACLREMKLPDDESRLNIEGGAVGLGHPVGVSGARLLVHLAHKIARGNSKRALAGLCVGGGQGIASILTEKPA